MTGKDFPSELKSKYIQGASELDLVRSGLEDTMIETYNVISDVWNSNKDIPDLRTAAMIVSIKRIAQSYNSLGI
jgi:glutamate dehydrogenase (NAD(P)+)